MFSDHDPDGDFGGGPPPRPGGPRSPGDDYEDMATWGRKQVESDHKKASTGETSSNKGLAPGYYVAYLRAYGLAFSAHPSLASNFAILEDRFSAAWILGMKHGSKTAGNPTCDLLTRIEFEELLPQYL